MCATLFLGPPSKFQRAGFRAHRHTKAEPDASAHSFFKCPTYRGGELSVTRLSGLAEKQHVKRKGKKKVGEKNTSQEKRFKVLERRRGE